MAPPEEIILQKSEVQSSSCFYQNNIMEFYLPLNNTHTTVKLSLFLFK